MTATVPDRLEDRVALIQGTGHVHGGWYRRTYPDAAALSMSAAEHYLRYGARLGYNPGKTFDTGFYLDTHPDVRESGMNPLLHYALEGAARGDPATSGTGLRGRVREEGRRKVEVLRAHLLSLGFSEAAFRDLGSLAASHEDPDVRARARRERALWLMRGKAGGGYRAALGELAAVEAEGVDRRVLARLATIEVLCHHFLGDPAAGIAAWDRASEAGLADADLALARVNLAEDPEMRVALLNAVLDRFGVPPIALQAGEAPAYDRLTARHPPRPAEGGPAVTVLLAAYDAAATLPTALRSLTEQSWRNLEILVIDDASPDGGATARVVRAHMARDPRIRLIEMETNGGAYVARNRGLDAATGEFVTLHDADDWCHPARIEVQVRHLLDNPRVIGCTTDQARATSDLAFTRWTGRGEFLIGNTSSFLFRRAVVQEHFGYWDSVRFSADNELIRRIRHRFGGGAVTELKTGPYSFQRDSETSIIASGPLGINGFLFGVRRDYFDAQRVHRQGGGELKYGADPATRPFPAPVVMRPERRRLSQGRHFDVVYAADMRRNDDDPADCLETIAQARAAGLTLGIFEMYRYAPGSHSGGRLPMQDAVRREIDGESVQVIGFGEAASCDLLMLRDPAILQEYQRYVPQIAPRRIAVIASRPPRDGAGALRYRPADCAARIEAHFGISATWHPADPAQRAALAALAPADLGPVTLAGDWPEVIDAEARPLLGKRRRARGEPLRLGRYGPDRPGAWPQDPDALRALCPEGAGCTLHVMGGAEGPAALLGARPERWIVHPEGAMPVEPFLAGIDVFVQSGHPDAPRRPVLEAMAAGVPVILTEEARPIFGAGALYAAPRDWAETARRLDADAAARAAQVARGRQVLAERFAPGLRRALLRGTDDADADASVLQT